MKQSIRYSTFILLFLILGLTFNTGIAYAQKPNETIEVDMGILDDFGNILADYSKEFFVISGDHFIYREPPVIDRYTFATANVLKLVNENGVTYRVNYFYTLDTTVPAEVPQPLLMSEMPLKTAPIEKIKVIVSNTDESMREITETNIMTLDYFWDTFSIPIPKHLNGYGFQRLETGTKQVDGKSLPQLVYVYKRGGEDLKGPSLIFAHLFQERAISTIKPEYIPPKTNSSVTNPGSTPVTQTETKPTTKPGTKPGTKPETKPETKPDSKPGTKPGTKPSTKLETKPDWEQSSTKSNSGSAITKTQSMGTQAGSSSIVGQSSTEIKTTPGSIKPTESNKETEHNRNGAVLGIALIGIAIIVASFIYSKFKK